MADSGIHCFVQKSLLNLKQRFHPELNDQDAAKFMNNEIIDSVNKLTTNVYDAIQKFQNDIAY